MALIERIKPDFEHKDERGSLVQLVRRGYNQINVVTSAAGTYRGGHFHKYNTEAYYVIDGKCKVLAQKENENNTEIFQKGDFFRIGPYVNHEFVYLEDTTMVTMYSLGVELSGEEKDIFE